MRWLFHGGLALALLVLYVLYFTAARPRLAFVDSGRLLHDYRGMTDARRTYHLHQQEWQRNLDTLQAETTRGLLAYQRARPTLPPAQRQATEARLQRLRQQYRGYEQAIRTKDGEEQQRLTQEVLDSTNAFVRAYGARHRYDLIFLTADGDNLAYATPAFDLTVPVLQGLNAKYAKEQAAQKP